MEPRVWLDVPDLRANLQKIGVGLLLASLIGGVLEEQIPPYLAIWGGILASVTLVLGLIRIQPPDQNG